jgi:hypothetical protein
MSIILALGRWKQEDFKVKASLTLSQKLRARGKRENDGGGKFN